MKSPLRTVLNGTVSFCGCLMFGGFDFGFEKFISWKGQQLVNVSKENAEHERDDTGVLLGISSEYN